MTNPELSAEVIERVKKFTRESPMKFPMHTEEVNLLLIASGLPAEVERLKGELEAERNITQACNAKLGEYEDTIARLKAKLKMIDSDYAAVILPLKTEIARLQGELADVKRLFSESDRKHIHEYLALRKEARQLAGELAEAKRDAAQKEDRFATDAELMAWADRHNLEHMPRTTLRCAFEDAQSFYLTEREDITKDSQTGGMADPETPNPTVTLHGIAGVAGDSQT